MAECEQEQIRAAKRARRAEVLARRAARDPGDRIRLGKALASTALAHPQLAAANCVCAYVGVGSEPPTGPLLDALRAAGVAVLLPVLAADSALDGALDGALDWALYEGPETLIPGPFGLLQPGGAWLGPNGAAAADLLVLPALAVDAGGWRLGRGGGYYDRLLAPLSVGPGPAQTWAVVYDDEVLEHVPHEAHDVRVTGVLTPSKFRALPLR